jgi:hypothetical protein
MTLDSATRVIARAPGLAMNIRFGCVLVPPVAGQMEKGDRQLKGYYSLYRMELLILRIRRVNSMYSRNMRHLRAAAMARSSSFDIFFRFTARDIFSGSTSRPLTRKLVSLSSWARLTCVWAINRISLSLIFLSRCHSDSLVLY